MSRHAVRRSLLLAPLAQHTGRLALSVLAIALGVALGYAVQLINQAAINEFAAAVQTLSGEADLAVRGPRAGFDESLYPRIARLPEVAGARPGLEGGARLPDRKSTRLDSTHLVISYAVFCFEKKKHNGRMPMTITDS